MFNKDSIIGQEIDGYRIDALLGHGGMGRVYRALDIRLNRYAAFKVMTNPGNNATSYRKRFDREAQAIAKLKHPNIVAIYRFNEINNIYYMAMEFVDGADLRWVLREYSQKDELIPYNTMLNIMQEISGALDYAHQNGVIHRDIKPSNIMIARDGTAILTDFGLALDVQEGTGGEIFGSPNYIAPEQAVSSAQAVPSTDFYSLGVILFEMLTGSVPFEGESMIQVAMAHISDPLPDPLTLNPQLHPAFVPILQRMLEKRPEDRFKNGAALVTALQSAVNEAHRDQRVPGNSTLGSPREQIALQLPPLPSPVTDVDTKLATRLVNIDSRATKAIPLSGTGQADVQAIPKRKSRIPRLVFFALLLAMIAAVAIAQFPEQRSVIIGTILGEPVSSGIKTARIEGPVSSFDANNGIATLTVYGVTIQLSQEMPLYDVVEADDLIRIDGEYTQVDGVLRFDRVTYARHNGETIFEEARE